MRVPLVPTAASSKKLPRPVAVKTPVLTFKSLLRADSATAERRPITPEPPAAGRERTETKPKREDKRASADPEPTVALDTAARTAITLAPPPPPPSPSATASPAPPPIPHQLAHELLDRAAFWGDGQRGVARLRFGSRARGLSGATVTLEHDGELTHLRVEDCDDPALIERLREQLTGKGVVLGEP